jgi:hypothetical protein
MDASKSTGAVDSAEFDAKQRRFARTIRWLERAGYFLDKDGLTNEHVNQMPDIAVCVTGGTLVLGKCNQLQGVF